MRTLLLLLAVLLSGCAKSQPKEDPDQPLPDGVALRVCILANEDDDAPVLRDLLALSQEELRSEKKGPPLPKSGADNYYQWIPLSELVLKELDLGPDQWKVVREALELGPPVLSRRSMILLNWKVSGNQPVDFALSHKVDERLTEKDMRSIDSTMGESGPVLRFRLTKRGGEVLRDITSTMTPGPGGKYKQLGFIVNDVLVFHVGVAGLIGQEFQVGANKTEEWVENHLAAFRGKK